MHLPSKVIYHKYCDKTKYTVRDNFIYALIGAGLLFVGQVNFFGIQVQGVGVQSGGAGWSCMGVCL